MKAAPPKLPRAEAVSGSRLNSRIIFWLTVASAVALLAVVFFFDPATHRFYPLCQFHRVTGWYCPGCGMTRSLHALLHGDFSTAWRDNALLLAGIIVAAARAAWQEWQRRNGRKPGSFLPLPWLWPLLLLVALFTVLRNVPGLDFLSPG